MKKILIIGSNFGSKIYLKSLKKIFPNAKLTIASPNIYKKKINVPNIIKSNDYVKLIKFKIYDLIICAATPKIQNKLLKQFFKIKKLKNIKTKLMLEKPLSFDFKNIFAILDNLKKNRILFNQNFIFPKIYVWMKFFQLIKDKKINKVNYTWKFKQAYFINKNKTWKINKNLGGGIILFYISHVIFNLLIIDKNIIFKKLILKEYTDKLITRIKFFLQSTKSKILVDIDINNKESIHSIEAFENDNKYKIQNLSKDWTKNFKLIINDKIIQKSNESRVDLTKKNIEVLIKTNVSNTKYKSFFRLLLKNYKLLYNLEKNVCAKK